MNNSLLNKRIFIYNIIYKFLLLFGYFIGYISINNMEKYYCFNELNIIDIFLHNFIVTIITLLLAFFGGLLSIFVISFNLVGIGFAIYEVQIRLKTSLFEVLTATMLHGFGEIIVMCMVINISLDIFIYWYYRIIKNKSRDIKKIMKKFVKIIILTLPILSICAVVEVLISSKLFEKIFLLGG